MKLRIALLYRNINKKHYPLFKSLSQEFMTFNACIHFFLGNISLAVPGRIFYNVLLND